MVAADIYAHIVTAMVALGYHQWTTTLSFREVPEASADHLFQVLPFSTDPQVEFIGSSFIDTSRKWRVSVLFRVAGSVSNIVKTRVLPAEEAISAYYLPLELVILATMIAVGALIGVELSRKDDPNKK